MRQLPLSVRPHDRALFESFHAGPNAAVVAQLLTLAERAPPGLTWLYGPAGSGKTHLLQAICARAGTTALYLPLSQVSSLGAAALGEWQGARCLCVDELAMVVGQIEWERELFALYRDCEERGASLVMAAREVPAQLPFALPDLALEESEQCVALRLRARQRGFELPEESALYLQRRLPRDMASLFALLDELDTAALAAQRRLTVPFIRDALARRLA